MAPFASLYDGSVEELASRVVGVVSLWLVVLVVNCAYLVLPPPRDERCMYQVCLVSLLIRPTAVSVAMLVIPQVKFNSYATLVMKIISVL